MGDKTKILKEQLMKEKLKDTRVPICDNMNLEIKEERTSPTSYSQKDGYTEIASVTRTLFTWKLRGIASKLGPEEICAEGFDGKDQEVYDVEFRSHGWLYGHLGFKTRELAIRNALEFAKRNAIEVDGYSLNFVSNV